MGKILTERSIKQRLEILGYNVMRVQSNPCRMAIYKDGKPVHSTPSASVELALEIINKAEGSNHRI